MKVIIDCILSLVLVLSFHACLMGQARTDRQNVTLSQKSGKLFKATGWMKDPISGKWISHPNYVGDAAASLSKNPGFQWMQTARFEYQNTKYFVFYYQKPGGIYKYPSIQEGWMSFNVLRYLIISLEEYYRFIHSLDKEGYTGILVASPPQALWDTHATEKEMMDDISSKFETSPDMMKPLTDMVSWAKADSIIISYQTVNNQKIVRFDPNMFFNLSEKNALEEKYFETDPASFKMLFIPLTTDEKNYTDSLLLHSSPEYIEARLKAKQEAQQEADEKDRKLRIELLKAEQARMDSAIVKFRKDSVAERINTIALIKDWKTSDTIYSSACKWMDATNYLTAIGNFDWLCISSFTFKNEEKHALYYKEPDEPRKKGKIQISIFNDKQYKETVNAINEKQGQDFFISAEYNFSLAASENNDPVFFAIGTTLLKNKKPEVEKCLGLYVKKKIVKFRLPFNECTHYGVGTGPDWRSFECASSRFEKLLSPNQ